MSKIKAPEAFLLIPRRVGRRFCSLISCTSCHLLILEQSMFSFRVKVSGRGNLYPWVQFRCLLTTTRREDTTLFLIQEIAIFRSAFSQIIKLMSVLKKKKICFIVTIWLVGSRNNLKEHLVSKTSFSQPTHTHTYVRGLAFCLSAGSLSVLTGCGPGRTTDTQTQGGRRRLALPSTTAGRPSKVPRREKVLCGKSGSKSSAEE